MVNGPGLKRMDTKGEEEGDRDGGGVRDRQSRTRQIGREKREDEDLIDLLVQLRFCIAYFARPPVRETKILLDHLVLCTGAESAGSRIFHSIHVPLHYLALQSKEPRVISAAAPVSTPIALGIDITAQEGGSQPALGVTSLSEA
ncbi:hypothetical protein R1flu_019806 [Riccia fluitans]|uniref:Uncharacterized protein n=1 Tax=Riccia fluitans TaxID=41844 RepID=A0ABD1ZJY2_9MARC